MYKPIKSSSVLASVMAMILWVPGSATWADEGRYDNDWHPGGSGWNSHYEGYRGNHAKYYPSYKRCYYPGYCSRYYSHYYSPKPPCGTCTKKKNPHHNNNNDHWW